MRVLQWAANPDRWVPGVDVDDRGAWVGNTAAVELLGMDVETIGWVLEDLRSRGLLNSMVALDQPWFLKREAGQGRSGRYIEERGRQFLDWVTEM